MGKAKTKGVLFLAFACLAPAGIAQDVNMSQSSSSKQVVVERKGYAFKYGQRLKDWSEQIDTGLAKGWLSPPDAQKFRDRIASLRALNDSVNAKGYPKADLDDMEKQFTQFNIDLSHASEPKPQAAGASQGQTTTGTQGQTPQAGAPQPAEKKSGN
jgi:hypothetical protein